jgi:hypothetical protein
MTAFVKKIASKVRGSVPRGKVADRIASWIDSFAEGCADGGLENEASNRSMTLDLPENFHLLHEAEETIRGQSLEAIKASEHLRMHAEMIEHTMSTLWYFIREHQSLSDDVRTIQLFGIRLFNATASVLKLLLSGYYQTSVLQQRDLLETIFLLDYFRMDQSLIAEWRDSTDGVRRKKFSPATVRKALDKRDGFTTGKRADAYKMFCELGAHPTYLGFHMLTQETGGDVYTGPFFHIKSLKAGLEELAKHLANAGGIFINLLPRQPSDIPACLVFSETQGQWAERFLGRPFDRSQIDELREVARTVARRSERA